MRVSKIKREINILFYIFDSEFMKNHFILIVLFSLLFSCSNERGNTNEPLSKGLTLKHLYWLAGTWKSVNNEEVSYEIWEKKNDTLLSGKGFTLVKNDTVFFEKLEIVQRGQELYYIPAVRGQNEEKPVEFRFMEFNKGEYNFVNKDHDFPQRIIYKNPQPDFLCARIEGTKNGKFMKIDFNFLKVKQ